MAKKEKLVDLKPEKISDEQLERMQKLVSGINKIQFDMGAMQAKVHELAHLHIAQNAKIKELQDELQEKYGTVDVNIQDGTITYKDEDDGSYD